MISAILVINAGSSNVKFAIYPRELNHATKPLVRGLIEDKDNSFHLFIKGEAGTISEKKLPKSAKPDALYESLFAFLFNTFSANDEYKLIAAGHRVVHGGEYTDAVLIDDKILNSLVKLTPLAPLHQPANLSAIKILKKINPELKQIACFDTAFHRTQPLTAQQFALPKKYFNEGIKRYGFHGLSYEYIAHVLPEYLREKTNGKIIVAHLGNGSSMCAIENKQSIATTMGFTALDGLPMGTRCGSLDPGVVLYLQQKYGMNVEQVTQLLYKQSGLLGLSGISGDMRTLLEKPDSDATDATNAIEYYVYRIAREMGSLTAALNGLDALIFTGGIGEHSAIIRKLICSHAQWLGIQIDDETNQTQQIRISSSQSKVAVLTIPTNEEWMIAKHTAALL